MAKLLRIPDRLERKFQSVCTCLCASKKRISCSAIMAAREKSTTVTFKHFESAIDRVIAGAEKKTNVLQSGLVIRVN